MNDLLNNLTEGKGGSFELILSKELNKTYLEMIKRSNEIKYETPKLKGLK